MTKISIFVCPNGFGHFRRAQLLIGQLLANHYHVRLFTNLSKWYQYAHNIKSIAQSHKHFELFDCSWLPVAKDYKRGINHWSNFKKLTTFCESDLIVSDNYLEPFAFCDNGLLLANFFWHRELNIKALVWHELEKKISGSNIRLVTSCFGADYIKSVPESIIAPLFGSLQVQKKSSDFVVLSLGFGSWVNGYEERIDEFLTSHHKVLPKKLIIDQNMSKITEPMNFKGELIRSKFTNDILEVAQAIVGRPSLGIVSDAFSMHVPFFPVTTEKDTEAVRNKTVISSIYKSLGIINSFEDRIKTRLQLADKGPRFEGEFFVSNIVGELLEK